MSDAQAERPQPPEKPSLFLEGYLDDLYRSGYRPRTGYPPSPLPKTDGRVMVVETSWFAGRKPVRDDVKA